MVAARFVGIWVFVMLLIPIKIGLFTLRRGGSFGKDHGNLEVNDAL